MRTALLAGLLAATAGCTAYRPPKPLDDAERVQLAEIVARLQDAGVRVVAPPSTAFGRDVAVDALDAVGFTAYRRVGASAPDDVELRAVYRRDDSTPSDVEMWLYVLTLGLYPIEIEDRSAYEVRAVGTDGRAREWSCPYDRSAVFGWLAIPRSWRDEWAWDVGRHEDTDEVAGAERLGFEIVRGVEALVVAPGKGL